MRENMNKVELHGCIVCARIFTILARYTPDEWFIDCSVTSPGGQRVMDEQQPLVACITHTTGEIEAAYKRWQSRNGEESDNEKEDK